MASVEYRPYGDGTSRKELFHVIGKFRKGVCGVGRRHGGSPSVPDGLAAAPSARCHSLEVGKRARAHLHCPHRALSPTYKVRRKAIMSGCREHLPRERNASPHTV